MHFFLNPHTHKHTQAHMLNTWSKHELNAQSIDLEPKTMHATRQPASSRHHQVAATAAMAAACAARIKARKVVIYTLVKKHHEFDFLNWWGGGVCCNNRATSQNLKTKKECTQLPQRTPRAATN